jgi:hypothetical protein
VGTKDFKHKLYLRVDGMFAVEATLQQIRSTIRGEGYVFFNPDTAKSYTEIKKAFATACL